MDKQELRRLSEKHLGAATRYVKLMEKGVSQPVIGARPSLTEKNEDGTPKFEFYQQTNKGVPLNRIKRYTMDEVVDLLTKMEKEAQEKEENKRLEKLAESVSGATGSVAV